METLTLVSSDPARRCTSDGVWCVEASANAPAVAQRVAADDVQTFITLPAEEGREPWPTIIRYVDANGDEGVIVGFTQTQSTMYSGGGAATMITTLYVLGEMPTTAPVAALVAPFSGTISIRACFSEADVAARRGACADEYSFAGALTLGDEPTLGPPPLTLTTQASTFPGQRSRSVDSTQAPPLSEADLVRWNDPTCSYTRTLTFDAASGTYTPNEPLPACSDYLEHQ